MTVLLVEDNAFFRQTFKEALLAYVPQPIALHFSFLQYRPRDLAHQV